MVFSWLNHVLHHDVTMSPASSGAGRRGSRHQAERRSEGRDAGAGWAWKATRDWVQSSHDIEGWIDR